MVPMPTAGSEGTTPQPPANPAAKQSPEEVVESVRTHYAAAAKAVLVRTGGNECCGTAPTSDSECCGGQEADLGSGRFYYPSNERANLPDAAVLASLGCGNPLAVADLHLGETVLDLGSGGGIDVLLSARRVGPTGMAYGVDMTAEMLDLARANAVQADADNVEFLAGRIEEIPLPDGVIDVVISNCVINLSVDKPAVFAEIARVLRPGGRIGISDIVAEDRLDAAARAERGGYAECVSGALGEKEYRDLLCAAGLVDVSVVRTVEVADGMYSAIIRATKGESK